MALFLLQAVPSLGSASRLDVRPVSQAVPSQGFDGAVTFDSRATVAHGSPSSAVPGSFARQLVANYSWSVPTGAAPVTVTAARLYLRLLGLSIATKEVDVENAQPTVAGGPTGNLSLVEDLSQYTYLVEGLYLATASIYANGTQSLLWTESFYVSIAGPSHLTAVFVLLLAIGLYEAYELATIRRDARREQKPGPSRSNPPTTDGTREPPASSRNREPPEGT